MLSFQRVAFTALFVCYAIVFVTSQTEETNVTIIDLEFNTSVNTVSNSEFSENIGNLITEDARDFKFNVTPSSATDIAEDSPDPDDYEEGKCPKDNSRPCLVKCCPMGESLGLSKTCEPSKFNFVVQFFGQKNVSNISADEDAYNYVIGDPCPYGKYRLEPRFDSNDEFQILENGSLKAPYLFIYPLQPHEYCLEVFQDLDMEEADVLPLICFKEPMTEQPIKLQRILYPIGLLISVPFLIVTMLVYCLIPELRDLHGKTLACHVMCLAVAYIFLAAVQLVGDTLDQDLCVGVAFVIHFSFIACFFWLNVLCFDTWWNVRSHVLLCRGKSTNSCGQYMWYKKIGNEVCLSKKKERRAFLYYSLYAWCCSILFVVISMTMDFMPTIPSSYLKPNFGESRCWFNSDKAELQYFYGPVGFLIFINVLLFLSAARKVYKHQHNEGGNKRTPRQTFRMCLTLFGVMGINWVMEVVSWAAGGPDYLWYFTDIVNTLQGVIIFCIFVLEPRIRSYVRHQLWPKIRELVCHQRNFPSSVAYRTAKTPETVDSV